MKYKLTIIGLCTLFLGGCATANKVYLADGTEGQKITCDGAASSFGVCLEKAGEICGARGYTLLDKDGSSVPAGIINANQYGGTAQFGAFVTRYILIKCK